MKPTKELSRQRRWQLRQQANGLCVICGQKAINRHFCLHHAVAQRERQRAIRGSKRRYQSHTYRLQKAA